jgi:hypothetical protein
LDPKLAKGLAREGFRQRFRALEEVSDTQAEVFRPYLEILAARGKLTRQQAKSLVASDFASKDNVEHIVFLKRVTDTSRSTISGEYDEAVVGGALSWGLWPWTDHEEKLLTFSLFADRVTKRSLELRRYEAPIYIREHATTRFLERGNKFFRDLTRALWPNILLLNLSQEAHGPAFAVPFMLPVGDCAFLGLSVLTRFPSDAACLETARISQQGAEVDKSVESPRRHGMMHFVSTFLSADELTPLQVSTCEQLARIVHVYGSALLAQWLGWVVPEADARKCLGLHDHFDSDRNAAVAEFRALVGTKEWRSAMRMPRNGVFNYHVELQRMLEAKALEQSK